MLLTLSRLVHTVVETWFTFAEWLRSFLFINPAPGIINSKYSKELKMHAPTSFQLPIKLPKIITVKIETITRRPEKWNFLQLFEEIQNKDLHTGNPWLDSEAAQQFIREKRTRSKTVRFNLTPEIFILPLKSEEELSAEQCERWTSHEETEDDDPFILDQL